MEMEKASIEERGKLDGESSKGKEEESDWMKVNTMQERECEGGERQDGGAQHSLLS